VYVFVDRAWSGRVAPSDELRPAWFPVAELPLDRMWDDEQYWLSRVLGGESLNAEFVFDDSCAKVARLNWRSIARTEGLAGLAVVPLSMGLAGPTRDRSDLSTSRTRGPYAT
ncbi:MAG: hypothetical protein M3Z00_11565, partial [Actinomycetota bacterium]|nr:hypothetical protein [Actinomycetota bacterium]